MSISQGAISEAPVAELAIFVPVTSVRVPPRRRTVATTNPALVPEPR